MEKQYRPKDWKQPYLVPTPSLRELSVAQNTDATRFLMNDAYEAGADALWEYLMKYRVKMPPDFKPTLIVIPSEDA